MDMVSIEETLSSFVHTPESPCLEPILSILQKCRKQRSTANARSIYTYMQENGLETHKVIGNHLIPVLVECGSLPEAEHIFNRMNGCRNEHSWTCLIGEYARHGNLSHAFELYHQMQDEGVYPSNFTFVSLLRASSQLKHVAWGREIHFEVCIKEFENDIFIGNSLIDMYTKCGCLLEAQEVFNTLPVRDVVSWNTLIAGYAECGDHEEALNHFDMMRLEGFSQDVVTYICILKACGNIERISKGQEIHVEIIKEGFEDEHFIQNSLVDMYASCGLLVEAQDVFDNLQVQDIVSWNSLIAGYAELGLYDEVMKRFYQMQDEGVFIDSVTFLCVLKACGMVKEINSGRKVHIEAVIRGLEQDLFVANTLMDIYLKCESFCDTKGVFDQLSVRDVVSWNALLTGFRDYGLIEEALSAFQQMQTEGVSVNSGIIVSILKSCGITQSLDKGHEIHVHIVKLGFGQDLFVGNSLIDMYAKCGSLIEAVASFNLLQCRDVVSWNTLIAAYLEHGFHEEVLDIFNKMQAVSILPDATTFVCVLKSCSILRAVEKGQELHRQIMVAELERVLFVGNSLVMFYVKSGCHEEAKDVFEELPIRDVVSWTSLILGYAEHGLAQEGLALFEQMKTQCVHPDSVILASCLKCCGNIGALEQGREVHLAITKYGFDGLCNHSFNDCFLSNMSSQNVGNAIIDMYAKCGNMVDAQKAFSMASVGDRVAWNTLIAGYARQEDSELVFRLVQNMMEAMILPDELTFLSILSVCSHGGLLNEGRNCFEVISNSYGIAITIGHCNCLLDLFGRSGQVDEATEIVESLPLQPNLVTWSTLLDAYRKARNVELSMKAFKSALRSSQENISSFILMSNIYAAGCLDMEESED